MPPIFGYEHWSLRIHWPLVIGNSLVIGHWTLVIFPVSCPTMQKSFYWLALCWLATQAHAQLPALSQPGLNTTLIKLFGNTTAFSSKAGVRMLDKDAKETLNVPMNFALLDE